MEVKKIVDLSWKLAEQANREIDEKLDKDYQKVVVSAYEKRFIELQNKEFHQYNIENVQEFQSSMNKALSKISDLRFPLNLIADDFYKSEKAIFKLKGRGEYKDLSPKYKKQKEKKSKGR